MGANKHGLGSGRRSRGRRAFTCGARRSVEASALGDERLYGHGTARERVQLGGRGSEDCEAAFGRDGSAWRGCSEGGEARGREGKKREGERKLGGSVSRWGQGGKLKWALGGDKERSAAGGGRAARVGERNK